MILEEKPVRFLPGLVCHLVWSRLCFFRFLVFRRATDRALIFLCGGRPYFDDKPSLNILIQQRPPPAPAPQHQHTYQRVNFIVNHDHNKNSRTTAHAGDVPIRQRPGVPPSAAAGVLRVQPRPIGAAGAGQESPHAARQGGTQAQEGGEKCCRSCFAEVVPMRLLLSRCFAEIVLFEAASLTLLAQAVAVSLLCRRLFR